MEAENKNTIMEKMLHTRDIGFYLDSLRSLQNDYLIILSVKDTVGNIPDDVMEKFHALGFTQLTNVKWQMYVGIILCGKTIFDQNDKPCTPIEYTGELDNLRLDIFSQHGLHGTSRISVNGVDWSMNSRSINIAVFAPPSGEIIDSSAYDACSHIPTFYHRNLNFSEKFFDEHFFIPEKYKEEWRLPFRRSYFSDRKLNVTEVENGIILPNKTIGNATYGGVCDENFNFIDGHKVYSQEPNPRHISGSYTVSESELDYIAETVIYGGTMLNHPGHLIIECFADRIWWFLNNPDSKYKIAICPSRENNALGKNNYFINEFLLAFGIHEEQIVYVRRPTKFQKIIIPQQCMIPYRLGFPYDYTDIYIRVYEKLKQNTVPSEFRKIYLTKGRTVHANIIGEEYFIDFYSKKGFKYINFEDYTLEEKIQLMNGADEIVSIDGTSVLYAVFCRPSVRFTFLSRVNDDFNAPNASTFQAFGITNFYSVDITNNFLHKQFNFGLSLLCITDNFIKYVKEVYNEEITITPEESLKNVLFEYLKYFSEYYSHPFRFNCLKNQKMLTILQNMSETFLGKEFDTRGLDLTTEEDKLRSQVKQLTEDLKVSKKRVAELERSDVYKAAKLIEATDSRLEAQITTLRNEFQNIQNIQYENEKLISRNNELIDRNADLGSRINELNVQKLELEKALFQAESAFKQSQRDAESLSVQLSAAQSKNDTLLSEITALQKQTTDYERLNCELQQQIANYTQSSSWRLTRPLRAVADFFKGGRNKEN